MLPTPAIAPAITCVVDTGMPSSSRQNGDRGRCFRANPPRGFNRVKRAAHCLHNAPSAAEGTEPDGRVSREDHPHRNVKRADHAGSKQNARDDTHRLLGVIRSMREAEDRSREKLQLTKVESIASAMRSGRASRSRSSSRTRNNMPERGAIRMKCDRLNQMPGVQSVRRCRRYRGSALPWPSRRRRSRRAAHATNSWAGRRYHVMRSQLIAPINPARITYGVTTSMLTPFTTVFAT